MDAKVRDRCREVSVERGTMSKGIVYVDCNHFGGRAHVRQQGVEICMSIFAV